MSSRLAFLALLLTMGLAACAHQSARTQAYRVTGPGPGPSASDDLDLDTAAYAERVHELVNQRREQHGVAPIAWDDDLVPVAAQHSRDMARRDYFAHRDDAGRDVNDRAHEYGLSCERTVGEVTYVGFSENLFYTYAFRGFATFEEDGTTYRRYDWKTLEELARETVDSWMDSPRHRANLLNPRHEAEAIVLVPQSGVEGKLMVTQVFC